MSQSRISIGVLGLMVVSLGFSVVPASADPPTTSVNVGTFGGLSGSGGTGGSGGLLYGNGGAGGAGGTGGAGGLLFGNGGAGGFAGFGGTTAFIGGVPVFGGTTFGNSSVFAGGGTGGFAGGFAGGGGFVGGSGAGFGGSSFAAGAAALATFSPGALIPGAFAVPGVVNPVDQNQLSGFGLADRVQSAEHAKSFPPVQRNLSEDALAALMPHVPNQGATVETSDFDEVAIDLHRSAGLDYTDTEPISLVTLSSEHQIELGPQITMTVQYSPSDSKGEPNLVFFDPAQGKYVPVEGSKVVGNSMQIDRGQGTMEVILDATSNPPISSLLSSVPVPRVVASLPETNHGYSDMIATATDASSPLPGYLIREINHNELFVCNQKTTGFYYAHDPSVLSQDTVKRGIVTVCDSGALVSEREGQIGMLNGHAVFMVSNEPFAVGAPGASLTIPADSAVLMEYNKATSMAKIALISQRDGKPATLNTSIGRPLFIKTGKTISVYQELPILKRIKLFSPSKEEVPMKAMFSKIEDFNIKTVEGPESSEKFGRVVKRIIAQPLTDPEHIIRGGLALNSPVRMLAAARTVFSIDKNCISLQTGNMFLHTAGQMALKTEVAELKAKNQSDVVVAYQNGRERIDVLSGPGLVNLALKGHAYHLNPGQEIVASTQPLSQQVLLPSDGVARRCFNTGRSGDTNVSTCDFEIITLMKNSSYMKSIRQPQNIIDGLLKERLLKTASVVTYVTANRGRFFAR